MPPSKYMSYQLRVDDKKLRIEGIQWDLKKTLVSIVLGKQTLYIEKD